MLLVSANAGILDEPEMIEARAIIAPHVADDLLLLVTHDDSNVLHTRRE
jgi:hypothetical protein